MTSFLTMAIATTRPHDLPGQPPLLLAWATLLNVRDQAGGWQSTLQAASHATAYDRAYDRFLEHLADRLPAPEVLIARSPKTRLQAPLIEIADALWSPLRHHLAARVYRVLRASVVDLDELAPLRRRTRSQNPARLEAMLKAEVIDDWMRFVARADGAGDSGATAQGSNDAGGGR